MENLRLKSLCLTGYLEKLLLHHCGKYVKIATPSNPNERGCQLSLVFDMPIENVHKAIEKQGIICDIRKPNAMRIAPTPLYNTFNDVKNFVYILKNCIMTESKL